MQYCFENKRKFQSHESLKPAPTVLLIDINYPACMLIIMTKPNNIEINIFKAYSPFRLTKTIPALFGILTITLHAYGQMDYLLQRDNLKVFLFSELSLFLLLCAGYLMNDIMDLKHDNINRPEAVYIGKIIFAPAAKILFTLLFSFSMSAALLTNKYVIAVISLQIFSLIIYNIFSKKLSYFKPIIMSLLFITIYPLSFAIASGGEPGPRRNSLYIFPVWLFFTVLSYEFICDAKDWKGDSISQTSGFTGRFGAQRMILTGKLLAAVSLPIAFIPYFTGMCGVIYLSGAVFAAASVVYSFIKPETDFVKILHFIVIPVVLSSLFDVIYS